MQADATAWMAFFCSIMLEISLTLSRRDCIYEDMASKFFEHFVAIADAINEKDGIGKSPSVLRLSFNLCHSHIMFFDLGGQILKGTLTASVTVLYRVMRNIYIKVQKVGYYGIINIRGHLIFVDFVKISFKDMSGK